MLKTSEDTKSIIRLIEGGVGVGNNSRTRRDGYEIDGIEVDSSEVGDDEVRKKVQKTPKSKNLSKSKKMIGSLDFFTPRTKLIFTKLR